MELFTKKNDFDLLTSDLDLDQNLSDWLLDYVHPSTAQNFTKI